VLVPPHPGLFSAGGLMSASLRIDESQTIMSTFGSGLVGEMLAWYRRARERLIAQLRADGIPASRTRVAGSVDCRYLGQGYELSVPLESLSRAGLGRLPDRFHTLHDATYGHAGPSEQVEIVTLRLSAFGDLDQPEPRRIPSGGRTPRRDAAVGTRRVSERRLGGGRPIPVFRRDLLRSGNRIDGPAIVDQMDSTTVVLAGQHAAVDRYANLWIRRGGGR
jgi:N-methylhydantoinase A/oxoprolinase/acetone carboxylase beta subunit